METVDARLKRITDAVRALDERERDDVLGVFEMRLDEQADESLLSDEQIEELERRMAEPQQIATKEQVEEIFAKYGTR